MKEEYLQALELKTKSGNNVPVRDVRVTAEELLTLINQSRALSNLIARSNFWDSVEDQPEEVQACIQALKDGEALIPK